MDLLRNPVRLLVRLHAQSGERQPAQALLCWSCNIWKDAGRPSVVHSRRASRNLDAAGDLAVRFPIRAPAGQEGVVWRGLNVAAGVDCARPDGVLAGVGSAPIDGPETPGVVATATGGKWV